MEATYYLRIIFAIILAVILGSIIGYERENVNSPAGIRTHVLVCLGACIVQLISINFYIRHPNMTSDPFRLGAQVVSGIGFLGAGTIMKESNRIRGLTTAASLWIVACIGLAIASQEYLVSIFSALLVFATLRSLKYYESTLHNSHQQVSLRLTTTNYHRSIANIIEFINSDNLRIVNLNTHHHETSCDIELLISYADYNQVLDLIKKLSSLKEITNTFLVK